MRLNKLGVLGLLCLLANTASLARATPADQNYMQVREFHVDTVQGAKAGQQSVHCWQVAEGTWNGQSLAGLSVVLIQAAPAAANAAREVVLYVNDFATPAQRQAIVAALRATQPKLFGTPEANGSTRIEPALIRIEQVSPGMLMLHLALIA